MTAKMIPIGLNIATYRGPFLLMTHIWTILRRDTPKIAYIQKQIKLIEIQSKK